MTGLTLPNAITIIRLIIVPLVIVMITQGHWGTAFILFAIAGLSDALDGYLARRLDMRSELGAYLDPAADKALLISIYITLSVMGILPVWLSILVVSRDIMIVSAIIISWLVNNPLRIKPLMVSKLNTTGQIVFAGFLLAIRALEWTPGLLEPAGLVIVSILTTASMAAYLVLWLRHMALH